MSVPVLFPDGTKRQVIAELRLDSPSARGVAKGRFVQCPINADPLWKYVQRNGQWIARPRFGSAPLRIATEVPNWWDGIDLMRDEAPATPCRERMGPDRRAA